MAMLAEEYEYYISENRNFTDPSLNGGTIGDKIEQDSMNVIFPELIASERETGLTRYAKIFTKNNSSDRKMLNNIFFIKQDLLPPDRIRLIEAKEKDHFKFTINETLDGATNPVLAGTNILITDVDGVLEDELSGRSIILEGETLSISSVDSISHNIQFSEDINFDVNIGTIVDSSDDFSYMQSDEDFNTAKKHTNSIIVEGLTNGTYDIVIPSIDKEYFEPGDTAVIVDGYHRVLYRGEVSSIADHGSNNNASIVSLVTPYSGISLPSLEAYICSGIKHTLNPGDIKSYWLELSVEAESSIDAEVINQFQTGASFDDITAL